MKTLKPKDVAEMLNVTVKTLQKWDRLGTFKAFRLKTNRRYYTEEQVLEFMGKELPKPEERVVLYARVSSYGQADDLNRQVDFLTNYAITHGYKGFEIIKDIGSGLNYERKKWNKLLKDVESGKVTKIIVTHKDRFIRFGFEWFEKHLEHLGCKLLVINQQNSSPQEEMIQDLISIIHVFSCRIYGLRKYKEQIKDDVELPNSTNSERDLFCEQSSESLMS